MGCGGIVTIALAVVGDRYPYEIQGRPMGRMFGGIAAGIGFGSTLGPVLNPLVGWRNEFRALACVCTLAAVFITTSGKLVARVCEKLSSFSQVIREYLVVLEAPRGGRTLAFIFCNGAFHGESLPGSASYSRAAIIFTTPGSVWRWRDTDCPVSCSAQ